MEWEWLMFGGVSRVSEIGQPEDVFDDPRWERIRSLAKAFFDCAAGIVVDR
jgi:hypothetical protein